MFIVVILLVLFVVFVLPNVAVVQQSRAYVIERLGAYQDTWHVGFHTKLPIIDRVAKP